MEGITLEVMAMVFKRLIEVFSSLPGGFVAEQGVLIAALARLESFSFQSMLDHLAFPAIDARRNWCHVVWPVDDIFDFTLQLGVQFIILEIMFRKMVIEHLMFENMISICLGDH